MTLAVVGFTSLESADSSTNPDLFADIKFDVKRYNTCLTNNRFQNLLCRRNIVDMHGHSRVSTGVSVGHNHFEFEYCQIDQCCIPSPNVAINL